MIVLVIGATSGFGAEMAYKFARHGHRVIAAGRHKERLDALAAEVGPEVDPSLLPVVMDVTERACIQSALDNLPADWKEIDVLINHAGLALDVAPAQQASLEEWETVIATNCKGLVIITRFLLLGMLERGRGHIINISSGADAHPYPGGNVYGETKALVDQFSRNLRAGACRRHRVLERAPEGRCGRRQGL